MKFSSVVRVGIIKILIFEKKFKGSKKENVQIIWWRSFPRRVKSPCKGPEAGKYLVCLRNSKESREVKI